MELFSFVTPGALLLVATWASSSSSDLNSSAPSTSEGCVHSRLHIVDDESSLTSRRSPFTHI
ncbi:hypothetical protein K443DRAFT_675427, partial [Laccaria amethystina LaAM-08-1]